MKKALRQVQISQRTQAENFRVTDIQLILYWIMSGNQALMLR